MAEGTERKHPRGFFGWVRAVDDGVFAVEQAVVALSLIAITVLMFVNVVARRIQAPDSKIGALIAKLGGVTDLEARAWIDANVAPWVTLTLSFLLIVFGYYTWRRFVSKRRGLTLPPAGRTLAVGAGAAAVLVAAAWGFSVVFLELESSAVFAGLFGLASVGYAAAALFKRPPRWQLKAAAGLVGGALVVWFCLAWFPIGYTWTAKVSLMLLLWVGLLGASVCVHEGKHIRMEALGKLAPPSLRRYVAALGFVVGAGFCAIMAWLAILYTFDPVASTDPEQPELVSLFGARYVFGPTGAYGLEGRIEGTDIPDWVGAFSVVVGFGLAAIRFVGAGVSSALGGDYGAPAPEEGLEEAKQLAGRDGAGGAPPSGEGAAAAEADAPGTDPPEAAEDEGGSGDRREDTEEPS